MERVAVTSSNVRSVGHDGQTLEVEFHPDKSGEPRVYRYTPVAREFFDRILEAEKRHESVGRIVHGLRSDRTVSFERVTTSTSQLDATEPALHAKETA